MLTDPYPSIFPIFRYKPIRMAVDIITISHGHFGHNKTWGIPGNPAVVRDSRVHTPGGIEILGISSFHDNSEGKRRGPNIIYKFSMDDIRLCHLGDLGHILTESQVGQIGKVDVLMAPVGGVSTAGIETIDAVCHQLRPRVIIPMHFRTNKTLIPLKSAEDFLNRWDETKVQRLKLNELEFRRGDMVEDMQVWLLQHDYKPKSRSKAKSKAK